MRSPHAATVQNRANGRLSRTLPFPVLDFVLGLLAGLAALALRLLHLLSLRDLATFRYCIMDEAYHDTWARRIAAGDWLGHEAFFRAPLYPYFLGTVYALFGDEGVAPRVIQDLIGAAGVIVLFVIARRLTDRWTAMLAAMLTACCWPLIYYDNELLITVLEVALSLAAILILMAADGARRRTPAFFLAGAAIGLAGIARPNILAFGLAAMVWGAWPRRGARWQPMIALVIALGAAVPVLPVTARNWIVGRDLVLISSQGGVNFYIGNNPQADGTTAIVPGTRPTWEGGYEDTIAIANEAERRLLLPSEVSRYWFRRGLSFWLDRPGEALKLLLRKTCLFFGGTEISNNKDLSFFRSLSPVLSLPLPGTAFLSPLGLVGWALALRRAKDSRRALAAPLLFAIPYAASIIIFFVTTRYRAPVLPVMALGAAFLVRELAQTMRRSAWRETILIAGIAIAAAIGLNLNPFGYQDDPGQGHLSLATAWSVGLRFDLALPEYDRAIAAGGPYTDEALRGKGDALAAAGRLPEAYPAYQRALEIQPLDTDALAPFLRTAVAVNRYEEARAFALSLPRSRAQSPSDDGDASAAAEIHFIVGVMDQAQGRLTECEAQYRQALLWRPDHLGARLDLALVLRRAGRLDESLEQLLECERAHPGNPLVHMDLAEHYLFIGDRGRADTEVREMRRLGGSPDPAFQAALDSH